VASIVWFIYHRDDGDKISSTWKVIFFIYLEKKLKYSHIIIVNTLMQACTTYGPHAACSPLGLTVCSMITFGNNIHFKKM